VLSVFLVSYFQATQSSRLAEFTYRSVDALLNGHSLPIPNSKSPTKGVFVTIESNGKVLGCRGTIEPSEASLELEIQKAAKSATLFDPRYHRVQVGKNAFAVTLTIVDRIEPLSSIETLRPDQGLILRSSYGVGVVLPWEGKDPITRLTWAYTKAKTPKSCPVKLERLFANRTRYPDL
jgi:AMMECR1 domain-containing protein